MFRSNSGCNMHSIAASGICDINCRVSLCAIINPIDRLASTVIVIGPVPVTLSAGRAICCIVIRVLRHASILRYSRLNKFLALNGFGSSGAGGSVSSLGNADSGSLNLASFLGGQNNVGAVQFCGELRIGISSNSSLDCSSQSITGCQIGVVKCNFGTGYLELAASSQRAVINLSLKISGFNRDLSLHISGSTRDGDLHRAVDLIILGCGRLILYKGQLAAVGLHCEVLTTNANLGAICWIIGHSLAINQQGRLISSIASKSFRQIFALQLTASRIIIHSEFEYSVTNLHGHGVACVEIHMEVVQLNAELGAARSVCVIMQNGVDADRLADFRQIAADGEVCGSAQVSIGIQRAIQQLDAVEVRRIRDTVDFFLQLVNFLLEVFTVNFVVVGAVGGLGRQVNHTVQHVLDFLHRALSGVDQRNAVLNILLGRVQTGDLGTHFLRNREASRVVASAVDLVAGAQTLKVLRQGRSVVVVVPVGVHRHNIVLNTHK